MREAGQKVTVIYTDWLEGGKSLTVTIEILRSNLLLVWVI